MADSRPPKTHWTSSQREGIETTGHSILVSAAAGSGKTAMLAARCAYLVCDAKPPCDVDELLVVTFTEAAAAEMKARIHAALRERADAEPAGSGRLRRQAALIDRASVCTLHSFCARMLREHFHAVGLDPAFEVLDGDEAALLRREVARELFDDRFELDESGEFQRFVDCYGEGNDARLITQVIHTHEMLASLVDPQGWSDRSRRRISQGAQGPLNKSELGLELSQLLARGIADLRSRCDKAIDQVRSLKHFPPYELQLGDCAQILRHWDRLLSNGDYDALCAEATQLEFPRLPPVPSSVPGKDVAKEAVDSVREAISKGPWRELLRFQAIHWQEGLSTIRPHADVFLGLVEDFGRRYRQAKDAARTVDFADLERFALAVLCDQSGERLSPSAAARAYHRQFAHVLVDEYQDINEVQDAILSLLSRECMCDDPGQAGNLFCVGDVKQSIYRFRLAEAGRFLDRQKLFRDDKPRARRRGQVIDLQANFRSRAPLLDAINGVFERLMTAQAADIDYDQAHRLHAGLDYPAAAATTASACFAGAPIELHLLPSDLSPQEGDAPHESSDELELDRSEREAMLVAQRVRQLMGLDGGKPACVVARDGATGALRPRPIRFADIVILLRSMRYKSEQFADILRRRGVPVHAQSSTGYFESMEVRDMLSLLSLLENQRQDVPLAAVLRSPIANLPEPENCFARVRLAFPAGADDAVPFHDAVVRYASEQGDELAAALRDFLEQLTAWRRLAHSRPLAEVIWTIYQQSGYLAFCSGLHDGEQRVANLMDLHERAAQFGSFRRQGLRRFMQFLEDLREQADLGQPSVASEADDVVRIMSIHRAKGLEFPVVILPDLGKRINFSDCQGTILADRTAGLGMVVVDEERMVRYPSLASMLVQRRLRQQALAEELRVLYVAMTRAREHLILVGTCDAALQEKWKTRWAEHGGVGGGVGAFPPDMILGARSILDWLGPVAVATASGDSGRIIRITDHSKVEIAAWEMSHARRPALSAGQARLAALEPLDPLPASNDIASDVIQRLEFAYPFDEFAKLAAADSVTAATQHSQPHRTHDGSRASRELPRPRFLAQQAPTAAEVGSATHRVLLHLDFRQSCDPPNIDVQLTNMFKRRLVSARELEMVDRPAIDWLVQSEVGQLLRSNAAALRRELPIHFARVSMGLRPSGDPQDRMMIRGRIDVLVPDRAGDVLIDYKTDAIPPAAAPQRTMAYAPQLEQYRQAIERITGRPVARVHLVYLGARLIKTL